MSDRLIAMNASVVVVTHARQEYGAPAPATKITLEGRHRRQ